MTNPRKQGHVSPTDGARTGRRAQTFVPTPEWVVVSRISPQAQALYTALLAHVNGKREDGIVWPGMDTLAELLGYSRRQSVRPYIAELVALGALDVIVEKTPHGRRNVYEVHEIPPTDYSGPRSLREFYDAWHAVRDAKRAAGQQGSGGTAPHPSGGTPHDPSGATPHKNQTNANQTNGTTRTTPPGVDDSPSSPSKQVLRRQLVMKRPNGYARMSQAQASQRLTATFISAVKRVGLEPANDAESSIGTWVNTTVERGITHDELWRQFVGIVERAVSGERCAWLVDDRAPF